jgi:hypothetical protein
VTLQTLLANPAALAMLAGGLVLAWRNRAALLARINQASADPTDPPTPANLEIRELTDNEALLARRLEILQGMRYDAADLPDEAERSKLLKFLDEARNVAQRLTPGEDALPVAGKVGPS